MIHLSQMLGKPVIDATGEQIGHISDIAIATGEVFPRVTSLAFLGPDKTPFMLSWRKFVEEFHADRIVLNVRASEIRFSYLQPDEVLLHRDLLNKQIVDTQGMKVVRVNDLKLSESRNQLRLLGAEVGVRGIIRGISPALETFVARAAKVVGAKFSENLIAWNYMDLLDRDLSQVKLSVTHKRLHELHPADVADILEQLAPAQRAAVFAHLDNEQAADTISELEDDLQADVIDDLSESRASDLLAEMDPDDAADIIGDLPYDKAERLLRLMGVEDASAIRGLLGYKEKTAGGIMTPEVTTVTEQMTVAEVVEHLRAIAEEQESINYVYVVEGEKRLAGVVSLRAMLLARSNTPISELVKRDLFTVGPDDDQELVAEQMSKYDLLAMPVVDERGDLLGIVTVDDALDVLEEESAEDLELATGHRRGMDVPGVWRWVSRDGWLAAWGGLFLVLALLAKDADRGTLVAVASGALVMLRLSEDIAGHAIARVIETEDENAPTLARRILQDGASGLLFGLAVGLVAFALMVLAAGEGDLPVVHTTELIAIVSTGFGLAVLLLVLGGTCVGWIARRRVLKGAGINQIGVSLTMQAMAVALFAAMLTLANLVATGVGVLGK